MPEDGFRRAVAHKASHGPNNHYGGRATTDRAEVYSREGSGAGVENETRRGFLLAEEDRMISPKTQRFMAERMGAKIRSHHVDHSPMYYGAGPGGRRDFRGGSRNPVAIAPSPTD